LGKSAMLSPEEGGKPRASEPQEAQNSHVELVGIQLKALRLGASRKPRTARWGFAPAAGLVAALLSAWLWKDAAAQKPEEHPQQKPEAMGVATGAPHAAVKDALSRPITAGGFVDGAPMVFVDITKQAGLEKFHHRSGTPEKATILETPGSGVALLDYDNDGWLDIYLLNGSTFGALKGKEPAPRAMLLHNNHDGTFTDVAVIAGCAYSENGHEQAGMGVAVADYDCDGWFDIFKTNFADDTCNLYHNNGDGTFSDVTFSSGIGINNQYVAWGCGFIDFDNDGWPDILQMNGHVYPEIEGHDTGQAYKNPRLVYKNLGDGRFKDVSSEMGPGISERFSSRGAAFGDYDNDGDIDALVLNMNDLPSLLRNDGGNQQNWIKIKLIGTKCNRTAIGARVRVVIGKHAQMDEVHSGSSVMSQSDLRLHFGLGKSQVVDLIEVKWPTTQKVERFTQVKANQILTIREGSGIVATVNAKTK